MDEHTGKVSGKRYSGLRVGASLFTFAVILLVDAGPWGEAPGERRQRTRETVKKLELIAAEYQTLTGDIPFADTRSFVAGTKTDLREMYKNFDDDLYDGVTAYDAWGHELRLVHPTLSPDPKLGTHPVYYFASPGEDGHWGDVTAPPGSEAHRHAQDNIRSIDAGR